MIEYDELVQALGAVFDRMITKKKLTDLITGVVTETDPLTVTINSKFYVKSDMIIVPDFFSANEYKTKETEGHSHTTMNGATSIAGGHEHTFTIDNSLKAGDVVHLLRVKAGKKYVIIGRSGK